MSNKSTWTVVKFLKDNSVEAVPTNWLSGDKCFWPRYPKERIIKAVKFCEPTSSSWEQHDISAFRNATYGDYVTARKKSQKAENTSDLNTDSELKRRIKPPNRLAASSSTSDSESDDSAHSRNPATIHHSVLKKCPTVALKAFSEDNNSQLNSSEVECDVSNTFVNITDGGIESAGSFITSTSSTKKITSGVRTKDECKCCPQHTERITAQLKQILRKLSMLELQVADIKVDINTKKGTVDDSMTSPENFLWNQFNFPLISMEELHQFDTFLADEDQNMKNSVMELAKLGGDSVNDFIRRALKKLLSNKLASQFSWLGLKHKESFSKLNISKLLIDATTKNFHCVTIKDIEEAIKKYLRRSKERSDAEEKKEERSKGK